MVYPQQAHCNVTLHHRLIRSKQPCESRTTFHSKTNTKNTDLHNKQSKPTSKMCARVLNLYSSDLPLWLDSHPWEWWQRLMGVVVLSISHQNINCQKHIQISWWSWQRPVWSLHYLRLSCVYIQRALLFMCNSFCFFKIHLNNEYSHIQHFTITVLH